MPQYIVKLEWDGNNTRYLVKNVKGFNRTVPFAFKPYDIDYKLAKFESKEDAIKAIKESEKYETFMGIPILLEVLEE